MHLVRQKISAMIAALEKENYQKFNSGALSNPEFTPNDQLVNNALFVDATYDYILNLTERSKSDEGLRGFTEKLEKYRQRLAAHNSLSAEGRFPGAQVWLNELAELEVQIAAGLKTSWLYEEESKYDI